MRKDTMKTLERMLIYAAKLAAGYLLLYFAHRAVAVAEYRAMTDRAYKAALFQSPSCKEQPGNGT